MQINPQNEKINVDICMYMYVNYIIYIIINDYITFIYGKKSDWKTYSISLIIIGVVMLLSNKYIKIYTYKLKKIDYYIIFIFCIIFLLRICIPESAFDTLNYHLLLQENPFEDYINYDFFPGKNINSFSYPLGDRMFYLFRIVLGYRMGIILNFIIIILSYLKLKDIFNIVLKRIFDINIRNNLLPIGAFFCLYSEKIYEIICIYYVDILYLPLILEIIYIVLFKKDNICSDINNIYIGIICGIITSLKITNVIYVIIIYLMYFIKNFKTLKVRHYILMILIPIFPVAIYMVNILKKTGNPVFPYYNSIFLSKYFANINWSDNRFGPKNLIEILLWPIIIFFNSKRTSELSIYNGRLTLAYFITIIYLLYYLFKTKFSIKKFVKSFNVKIALTYILLNILWSKFMLGYIRYALILEALSGIIIIGTLIYLITNIDQKNILSVTKYILSVCLVFNIFSVTKYVFFTNIEMSWRQPFYRDIKSSIQNGSNLFIDKGSGINDELLNNIKCWGIVDYNAGYAKLLKENVPIISLNSGANNDLTNMMLNERENKYKDGMYTIADNNTIDRVFDELNRCGYCVSEDIIKVNPKFINTDLTLYLMKIVKDTSDDMLNNRFLINNENREYLIDLDQKSKVYGFKAICGLDDVTKRWNITEFNLDFYLMDYSGLDKIKIYTKKFSPNSDFEQIQFNINLEENKYSKLIISVSSEENKDIDSIWVDIINAQIIYENK